MNKKLKRFFFILLFLIPFFLAGCDAETEIPRDKTAFTVSATNCWPCVMYMYAFKSIHNTIDDALEKVAQNSLIILEICLLFWLLFKVGNIVFSIAMPDMKKQLGPILTVLFKALIVIIFLTNTQFFYDFFGKMLIQPFGAAFLSLSEQILTSPTEIKGMDEIVIFPSSLEGQLNELKQNWNKIVFSGATADDLDMFGEIPTRVINLVYVIYASLSNGLGLAYQLFELKNWNAFFSAILLIIAMYWLILMVPLFLVEAFIKMGMVLLLMPLFMVGWVFTFPKDIVKKVFHSLFSGFFDILFNCIYIAFFITTLHLYNGDFGDLFDPNSQVTAGLQRVEAQRTGTNFVILLVLSFVMLTLSNHIQEFSNHFFEGAEKSNMIAVMKSIKDYTFKAFKYAISLGKLAVVAAIDGIKGAAKKSKGEQE